MAMTLTRKLNRSALGLVLTSLLASLLVVITGVATAPSASATAAPTCVNGSAAQNSIAVEPSHPTVMYIDSGMNPKVDAAYIGYRVSNRTGAVLKGHWASLDNFTGGVVSLANPLDKFLPLPEIGVGETKTVYFLVKASASTKTAQAHDFKIYDGFPGSSGNQSKYACNFAFKKVAETIKASANKPTDTTVSAVGAIGTTFTVTSEGGTGTIGQGNPDVGRILWFTPAAYSSFPTRAYRLESVVLKVGTKSNFATNGGEFVRFYKERTFVKTDTKADSDAVFENETLTEDNLVGKRFYENVYTFRVLDAASASIAPIAQISSGTQIKHSVITTNGTGSISSTSSIIPATIAKALVSTSYSIFETPTIGGVKYTAVPYRVTLAGTTSTSVTADRVVDYPATGAIYKVGSTQVKVGSADAAAYSDPETFTAESAINPQPLHFIGPFTFNSASNVVITYTMYIPSTAGTYTNSASAFIGDRRITSSTAASIPAVNITVNETGTVTNSANTVVKLLPDPLTKLTSALGVTTATITGSINANDTTTAGYFEWGTSPTLATYTSVDVGAILGNAAVAKSTNLTGLSEGTTYYYRIVALSFGVRYEGAILDFRTLDQQATPTITTDAPTSVSTTDATLNATVDPNLTEVRVAFKIWRTTDTATVWVLDDPGLVENNTEANANYNPRSLFSGASPTSLSIKMTDVATNLSSWIVNGATIYYQAVILGTAAGSSQISASEIKQFTFADYLNQTLGFDAISDITWGDSAPTESASATSDMAVIFTSQTTDVCTVTSSGVITVLKAGICSIAANQPGGLKTAGTYYNPAEEVIRSFTINPEAITITAQPQSKNYGDTDPALTYTVTTGSLNFSDAFTGSLSRANGVNVGTYAITQGSVALSANYTLSYIGANLTISARPITVTAAAKTKVYGASDPALTYSVTSGSLVSAGDLTGSLSRASGENVGTYAIGQNTLIATSNYALTYVGDTLTITSKPLTIKADSKTKASGQSAPGFTYTLIGLSGSDSITAVTLTFTRTTPIYNDAIPPTGDGDYVITPSSPTFGSGLMGNYNITYETGTYTITNLLPQVLTWTTITTKTYGDIATANVVSSETLTVTVTSLSPSICTVPSSSVSGATVTILAAGTCQLNASQAGNGSIAAANDVTTTFTVNPKPLTITASSHSVTEGDAVPTITGAYSAFAFSETAANLTGTLTCSTVYMTSSAVGSYATSCTGKSSTNYSITYVAGSVTVSSAVITTYTITYNLNGGSGTTPTETSKSNGQTFTTPSGSGFTRAGFTFGGWSCNSATTAINTVVTVGTSNFTCVAIWTQNASSSPRENNPASPAPTKRTATVKLVTISTTPVKSTISNTPIAPTPGATPTPAPTPGATPTPAPTPGATPTPAPTPGATPTPAPTPGATPTPAPTPGATGLPEGVTLSTTTVIPTINTKPLTFKGSGISKVAVVNEEVSVEAKRGFSGKTTVVITLESDAEITEITAEVLVFPLPVTNPVVREISPEKTRINWGRSPNAIGYEVIQNGEIICTTKTASCTVNRNIAANLPVEIKALGKDQTESTVKEATYVAAPVRVVPDVALVINFGTNRFNLDTGDRFLIRDFAFDVILYGFKEVDISGHTDSRGGVDNNILSNNRAKAARDYLLRLIPNLKVTINGFADAISVASNATTAGLAANRRAEFRVVR